MSAPRSIFQCKAFEYVRHLVVNVVSEFSQVRRVEVWQHFALSVLHKTVSSTLKIWYLGAEYGAVCSLGWMAGG